MKDTKVISFWGKGGVGKSTLASALSLLLSINEKKTLLVSTDYVPSLDILFNKSFRENVLEINDFLAVLQLSEEAVRKKWKEVFGEEVYRVVSEIFPVGREVIDYIAGAPGIVEQFIIYFVYKLAEERKYDYIVWDTMAAGGGLRMIRIEKEFYEHLGDAVKMYFKVKSVLKKLQGEQGVLEIIESWKEIANQTLYFLANPDNVAFVVTRPYRLDYFVSKRIISELEEFSVNVGGIIVNAMPVNRDNCQNFVEYAKEWAERIKDDFGKNYRIYEIPFWKKPPSGREELILFGKNTDLKLVLEDLLD